MKRFMQRGLMVTAALASLCGTAGAAPAAKDWYLALRLGYQPYHIRMQGDVGDRSFDETATLKDIMDNTDTTILGGELEFGKDKWFTSLTAFYQKSKAESGNDTRGADVTFTETAVNPVVGYRLYQTGLGGDKALSVSGTVGVYYVKVKAEVDINTPNLDISENKDIDFLDPMFGARAYLALTKKFGVSAAGQIGGFGVGSELNYLASGNLVYNFTDWFALSGGYRYWYWKYEDDDARLSRLEQTLHGPVVGLQLKY
ncbi:MAG: hypothetical protein IH608_12250 [Proteobacteria bacterium]|nr:hypothetical protein [Pseudomonadota bacterium]